MITSLSDYWGRYPFRDCTCAHGILVLVWALAPNTPLQTSVVLVWSETVT